jgi:amino acid adenylation domain-containing protein
MPPHPSKPTSSAGGVNAPLHVLLDGHAEKNPERLAFRHLIDGDTEEQTITYGELASRARKTAMGLIEHGVSGKPLLLIDPPGLGFIEELFACWYAGAIAVPCYPPRGRRHRMRFEAVLSDSGAAAALVSSVNAEIPGIRVLNSSAFQGATSSSPILTPKSNGPCLLQYTSGSTASPKGVMISHRNFRSHFAALSRHTESRPASVLSWLPPYHDMGLVMMILYAFEAGIPLTFFAPEDFIRKPVRWLRAISRYRAELSGAPNFAYETCLRTIADDELEGLDLSCWKMAFCGAERVRPETMEGFCERFAPYGFRREAFLPGYGLAEATLTVTCSAPLSLPEIYDHPLAGRLVSNGPALPGIQLRIADPENGQTLPDGKIGEIRIKGDVVSEGYWNNAAASLETFGPWNDRELRTGDLGFLHDDQLYVSGRIKDMIILDGIKYSPEDIETAAISGVPEISAAAAFSSDQCGRECITLVVEASSCSEIRRAGLCEEVRRVIADTLEVPLARVIVVRNGLIPRTTSGKIRRSGCRESLVAGDLRILYDDHVEMSVSEEPDQGTLKILLECVAAITGRNDVGGNDDVIRIGMGSLDATRLAAMMTKRTGVETTLSDFMAAGSFARIPAILSARQACETRFPEIVRGSGTDTHILTHAQERMWILHQLEPRSAAYHVFGALELTGPLSADSLRRAFETVVSRHDILCSRHGSDNGRPWVWLEKDACPPFETIDDPSAVIHLAEFARRPFNLADDPPIRACLITRGANSHLFAVCAHHIAADGWSMRLLAKEASECYNAYQAGVECPLPPVETRYLDYAACHRRWIDGGAVDSQIEYWKNRLAGHSGILRLPTDFPRPPKPSSNGSLVERTLPAELATEIARVAMKHRVTPFMVHLAAFFLLLRQHGGGDDSVVAIPVANRNHHAAAALVGTLVNTLPFRMILDPQESFSSLIGRIRAASLEMQENQDAPFEKIIEAVRPDRANDHSPLVQVMFDHQEMPISETWSDGLTCRPFVAHRGAAQFDISLFLTVFGGHQQISIEYREDLFLAQTAEAMLGRQLGILEELCRNPQGPVCSLDGLSRADREWLVKVSNGPQRTGFPIRTTPAMISERAAAHPDRHAVAAGGATLDYQELWIRSDQLATNLRRNGVSPGDRVAVMLERDAGLPAVLLAIWKAGAAYVPLDNANPIERQRLIIEDQYPVQVLVSPQLADQLPPGAQTMILDEKLYETTRSEPLPAIRPEDTAYVIYTSGSTGRPKGVAVSHGALANFLQSMAETPGFSEADRLLALTTISFDISLLEIFLPLICGGSLEIISTETARDGRALRDSIDSSGATVIQATPATWRMLIDAGWQGSPDLKLLCGGEAMDLPLASSLSGRGCQLWNLYGPTETTVWSTLWRIPQNPKSIRIGMPIANTGVHIMSDDGSPVPPEVPGNLWISGSGLAEGYWAQPALTGEKYREIVTADGKSVRAYQTGDIARWHDDGTLECMGRSDGQVKIRGFRVELGEIEAAMASHPLVAQARTALRGTPAVSEKLVAWITLNTGAAGPLPEQFHRFLSEKLPAYMLPSDIAVIAEFPLNSNGKVDISGLQTPATIQQPHNEITPTEEKLTALWMELLHRTSIHGDDNWFHIGGHSLLALRLFSRIHHEFHRSLPLSAILDHPTPRALATVIDETPESPPPQNT